jgi:hypothetical protein
MFIPAEPILTIYLLLGPNYVTKPIEDTKPYKPYTTTMMMTAEDMYDIDEIIEKLFEKEQP